MCQKLMLPIVTIAMHYPHERPLVSSFVPDRDDAGPSVSSSVSDRDIAGPSQTNMDERCYLANERYLDMVEEMDRKRRKCRHNGKHQI